MFSLARSHARSLARSPPPARGARPVPAGRAGRASARRPRCRHDRSRCLPTAAGDLAHPQPLALDRVRRRVRRQHHGPPRRDDRQRRRPVHPRTTSAAAPTPSSGSAPATPWPSRCCSSPAPGWATSSAAGGCSSSARPASRCSPPPARSPPTSASLIAFRALQGAFGALMIPQGFGLMREVFDDDEFGKATGLFGPAMGLPMLAAPILAGALVDAEPVGHRLAAGVPDQRADRRSSRFALALRTLPRGASHPGMKLDVTGVWLDRPGARRHHLPADPGPARRLARLDVRPARRRPGRCCSRSCGGRSAARADALIEPSLLTNRNYLSGIAVALALFGAFSGLLLCVSLFGQLGEGWSPIHAGLTLTPMVVGMIVGHGRAGRSSVARLGRHVLHIGLLVIAAGAVDPRAHRHRRPRRRRRGTCCPACSSSASVPAPASVSCSSSSCPA